MSGWPVVEKPCPFCGGEAYADLHNRCVTCSSCVAQGPSAADGSWDEMEAEMVRLWDRREGPVETGVGLIGCPFCARTDVVPNPGTVSVYCKGCGAEGPIVTDYRTAWSRRAG